MAFSEKNTMTMWVRTRVGPGKSVSLQVDGVDGVPASGVATVVLNVTAVGSMAR
jgi:hypothetical protein